MLSSSRRVPPQGTCDHFCALATSAGFAQSVYDALRPGSSIVVTDQPLGPLLRAQQPILAADEPLRGATHPSGQDAVAPPAPR